MTNVVRDLIKKLGDGSNQSRQLITVLIAGIVGVLSLPHDTPVATIATEYIYPSFFAGVCFGVAAIAVINFCRSHTANRAFTENSNLN